MNHFRFLALLLLTSCSFASENITDEINVLSTNMKLIEKNGKCYLIHDDVKKSLHPIPPCHFLRNSKNNVQYFTYKDIKVDAALIITGTPVSKEVRKEWGLPNDLVCGTESQGILMRNSKIEITEKTLKEGVLCRDKGSDEKNFWYFSH